MDVKATNHGMPEGLSRVLDMMAACISPTLVSSELKDGNGQNLTDAARAKAENMKRLRGEIMTLETQLNAARNGLESNIQRIRSTAESQQNAYQAALTRLLGNLGDSDTDKEKADTYGDAMDEVNQSWTAFRSRTAELVKLVADSGEANDGVSDLLGLKAFDSKSGQAAVYAEGEAQYKALAALMKSAIESQKTYDSAEEGLLSKRAEYNNAVSGALPASSGSNAGGTPGSGSV